MLAVNSTAVGNREHPTGQMTALNSSGDSVSGYWLFRAPVDSADLPTGYSTARRFGPNDGNGRDVGVLWRQSTLDNNGELLRNEERYCGAWVQFFFDELDVTVPATIENIYIHAWTHVEETTLPIGKVVGIATEENFNHSAYYDLAPLDLSLAWPSRAGMYDLTVTHHEALNIPIDSLPDLWGVSIKLTGGLPQLLSYPNQRSFCIVNLPDSTVLAASDTDADGLSDYQELFVTYTDPCDKDTDDDGRDDAFEHYNGMCGWDSFDWGTIHEYVPDGLHNHAFVAVLNCQDSEPTIFPAADTLQRELTLLEYKKVTSHDHDSAYFPYSSDTDHEWSMAQLNAEFTIQQDPDNISAVVGFFAGVLFSYDAVENVTRKDVEIVNPDGTDNFRFSAKLGHTPVLYQGPLLHHPSDFISADGNIYLRLYTKNRQSSSALEVDLVKLWIVAGASSLDILDPSPSLPVLAAPGDTVQIAFTVTERDIKITYGVIVDSVFLGGVQCELLGNPSHTASCWQQSVVVPNLSQFDAYDLQLFAGTPSLARSAAQPAYCYVSDFREFCGNIDGQAETGSPVNVADLTYFVNYLFRGGPAPPVMEAANVDGAGGSGGTVNISDLTYLVAYLFQNGPEPVCQ